MRMQKAVITVKTCLVTVPVCCAVDTWTADTNFIYAP